MSNEIKPADVVGLPTKLKIPLVKLGELEDKVLSGQLQQALDTVPAGRGTAFVTLSYGPEGARLKGLLVHKLNDDWEIGAAGNLAIKDGKLHPEGEIVVQGSW